MRRHSWGATESQKGTEPVERCAHCQTERVRDTSTKSLYEYRGGKAIRPGYSSLTVAEDRWTAFMSGAIPQCVERG